MLVSKPIGWISAAFKLMKKCINFCAGLMTIKNLVLFFILMAFFPHPKAILTTEMQQHFVFEPVGYTKTVRVQVNPSALHAATTAVPKDVHGGYFTFDKQALWGSLTSIPVDVGRVVTDPITDKRTVEELLRATPEPQVSIVLDLALGPTPFKQLPFISNAVNFLIGYAREQEIAKRAATAIPTPTNNNLEVVVKLQSAGGAVEPYGLVASQLARLRQEPAITLTISCDVMALSGGYLVASVASPGRLLAAPFASIGSIGVISRGGLDLGPLLDSWGIKHVQVKSGKRKPTVGGDMIMSNVTAEDVRYLQESSDRTHTAFSAHVKRWRGEVISDKHMDTVTSGDSWLGHDALGLGLVDELITFDEYIERKIESGTKVVVLRPIIKKGILHDWFLSGGDNDDESGYTLGGTSSSSQSMRLVASMMGSISKLLPVALKSGLEAIEP
jgi:ClpP class serine protease